MECLYQLIFQKVGGDLNHLPLFLFDAGKLLKSFLAIEAEDSSQQLATKN
jgi:hypothetical protein